MLLFRKLVDETQISKPKEYTDTFKQTLTCIFQSVRGILKETVQCETPCMLLQNLFQFNLTKYSVVKSEVRVRTQFREKRT